MSPRLLMLSICAFLLPSCGGLLQRTAVPVLHAATEAAAPVNVVRVRGLRADQKFVALTIDDAPSERTGEVLDLLGEYKATATFFVHGDRIRTATDRALIRRMLSDGHEVANHMPESYPTAKLPPSVFRRQFMRNHEILTALGAKPARFRPSHGFGNKDMRRYLEDDPDKLGYVPKFYLASNFCWDVYGMKPERYAAFVTAAAKPGRIVVFHDNQDIPDRKTGRAIDQTARTLEALPAYFESLRAQGFAARSLAGVEALAVAHP